MADPRLDAYANWLVQNKDKQGTPEFETVATAYKSLRGSSAPTRPQTKAEAADAYVQKEDATAGTLGQVANGLEYGARSLAQGVPIVGGLYDEAMAGASTLLGRGSYEDNLDYQRARDRFLAKEAPGLNLAGNVIGGVESVLLAAPLLGAAGIGATATGTAVPLYQQALRTAAVSAPIGAADFFTRGEGGFENRAKNAAGGAVLGTATGAVAPYVGAAVGSVYQRARDLLTSDALLQRLGLSRAAGQEILAALQGDDTLTGTGMARIRAAGPNGMLADAGPNAASALDTAMNAGGAATRIGRDAVEARAAQSSRDLNQTLDNTLGQPVGVQTRIDATRNSTAAARGAAYDAAYDQPIDFNSPAGQQLARDIERIPQWAIQEAEQEIAMRGEQPTVVRILDRATRALNSAATRGERGGALGGNTPLGGAASDLSGDIRQALRAAVPEYGAALDTAADPIRRVQATKLGQGLLNPNFTRDELAQELRGITPPERQAALGGVRDAIDEMAAKVTQMASDPNIEARELRATLQALTSRSAREKMQMILGDENRARAIYGQIGRAMRSLELRAAVATNSRTAARQEAMRRAKDRAEGGVLEAAQRGELLKAARKAFQHLTGSTDAAQLAREQAMFAEIAQALTGPRGRDAERYLQNLVRAANARARSGAQARRIGQAAGVVPFGATQAPAGNALGRPNQP